MTNATPNIRAAVIGCGRMGAFTSESVKRYAPECWFPLSHIEAMKLHPCVEVAAACDSSEANLARAVAVHGIGSGFTDSTLMVESVRPGMLGIATRTPGRAAILSHAFAHGVRAFHVEKPLCNSVAELESLMPLLEAEDCYVTYGAIRRLFRIYGVARELAESGEFGVLQEVRVQLGRGQLFWTHPHSVDLILFAAAGRQVAQVQARLSEVTMGGPVVIQSDPYVELATVEFDDGVIGQIGRGAGAELHFICSAGEIRVANDGRSLELRRRYGSDPYLVRTDYDGRTNVLGPEGVYAAIAHLVDGLMGDEDMRAANCIIKKDIFTGQRVLFAITQSHLEGSRPVSFEDIDPGMAIEARSGRFHA